LASLAARHAERLLRLVAAAEEIDGDEPFMPEHLENVYAKIGVRMRSAAAVTRVLGVLDNEERRS
jgi:hypothetical protein